MGTESLDVAQNTYAVKWFKGKELNAVFGIQFSVARIVCNNMLQKIFLIKVSFSFLIIE